ncbi:MAG: DNA polymerase/3'-5' exonuclease PolX [Rhodospirillaceae bacterium]|nr:DNA polymerase/3'-5' exonuclease PolX [Rhodospirillaceae bacterium]
MGVSNLQIAETFNTLADLLEMEGANPFRVRAYRTAARTIATLPRAAAEMVERGEPLSDLPGIGKDLAGKVAEIVRTGRLGVLEEVKARMPASLTALLALPSLGPKRVEQLHQALGVATVADLSAALAAGRLEGLRGFGPKLIERLKAEVARQTATERRFKLAEAEQMAEPLLAHLRALPGVVHVTAAGSYRRRRDTVGDLDIVVTARRGVPVMNHFLAYEDVAEVVAKGPTRATVLLKSGLQVDLRLVPEASYGAALVYFTGSKAHNIAIRRIGVGRGLKINEYGVFRGDRRIAGRSEAEVYAQVGLPVIPPELREDGGEIEAARAGTLPRLVRLADIRGDLHVHTTASDGRLSLEDMARAARARGYAYVAITDHSKRVAVAHGLDARRLAAQIDAIDRLNERLDGLTILKSVEVDILEDGSLDLPDDILKRLDFTVCSIHYQLGLPADRQTERIIRAMDNPHFTILGHPTGRLIGEREPSALDMERVMAAARDRGCFLEVNAQPDRLDLTDVHCRMAKEIGVKVAISTDAHGDAELDFMRFGVDQARRGWLEPADVLNTRPLAELRRLLRRP